MKVPRDEVTWGSGSVWGKRSLVVVVVGWSVTSSLGTFATNQVAQNVSWEQT